MTPREPLFHLALAADWEQARRTGAYTGSTIGRTLDEEGFVHCCFAAQVQGTADAFYRGRDDVVLLRIDRSRLDAEVRVEAVRDSDAAFPHIYGPVPLDAVVRADPAPPGTDGRLLLNGLLELDPDRPVPRSSRAKIINDGVTSDRGYLLDNQQQQAGTRFQALSALFDPVTFAHMTRLGVRDGWRCWEVGAGGASVPGWIRQQVGPSGHVLATDIDLSWLPPEAAFETGRHELGTDDPPGTGFDLVHARLVLVHVPDRERGLADLIRAVRPGGWLLVEEADPDLQPLVCPDETGPAARLANRLKTGFRELMAGRGVDLAYGRTLPRRLRDAGLEEVGADAYFPVSSPTTTLLEIATVEQIRSRLTAAGLATDEEIDRHLDNVRAGSMDLSTSPLISAWGRKPL